MFMCQLFIIFFELYNDMTAFGSIKHFLMFRLGVLLDCECISHYVSQSQCFVFVFSNTIRY